MTPSQRQRLGNGQKVDENESELQPTGPNSHLIFGRSRFGRRSAEIEIVEGREFISVVAPRTFSLVRGVATTTEKAVEFLAEIEWYLSRNRSVIVDFTGLKKITTDAILALWSLPVKCGENSDLRLRLPRNHLLLSKMQALGLYEVVQDDGFAKPKTVAAGMMVMLEGDGDEASATAFASGEDYNFKVIRDVIAFSSTKLLGVSVHFPNLKMLFDELKTNVMQHASGTSNGKERWFFSAYYDDSGPNGGIVRFNLIDHGVGILARIRTMWDEKFQDRKFKWTTPESILKGVLSGEFRSLRFASSGEGLPTIPKMIDRNMIGNVVILANNVIGRLQTNGYTRTDTEFSGSVIHWETTREQAQNLRSEA